MKNTSTHSTAHTNIINNNKLYSKRKYLQEEVRGSAVWQAMDKIVQCLVNYKIQIFSKIWFEYLDRFVRKVLTLSHYKNQFTCWVLYHSRPTNRQTNRKTNRLTDGQQRYDVSYKSSSWSLQFFQNKVKYLVYHQLDIMLRSRNYNLITSIYLYQKKINIPLKITKGEKLNRDGKSQNNS